MSRLGELINELCPNGVKFISLGKICEIKTGKGITKKESSEDFKYPIISGGKTAMGYYKFYNREENTVTVSRVGANAGYVNYIKEKFYLNDKCFSVIPNEKYSESILKKYLYFIMKSKENNIICMQSEGGVPTINTKKISSLLIPVPPLSVQAEIVHVLDSFTELTAELVENLLMELDARKKQYEYYLNLLINDEKYDLVPLSEIATLIRGGNFQKKDYVENGIPCIHYGQIYTDYGMCVRETISHISDEISDKQKYAEPNDIIMAVTSENIEDVCKSIVWLGESKVAVSGHTAIIKHNQNAKYLCYYFHSKEFQNRKRPFVHGTKVMEVTPSKLNNLKIPVPPISVQNEIVNILDNLTYNIQELSEKLTTEIETRKIQYEYYRDELLTFKELGV